MKKKRILLIILGVVIVSIAALTVSLSAKNNATINRDSDLPVIVYNKFDVFEKSKDLYVYQIGDGKHKFANNTTIRIYIGNNDSLMAYSRRTGSYTENDIYIVDREGQQQFLDSGVMYYEIFRDSDKIFYCYSDQRDTLIIKQYLDNRQIVDVDKINCSSWVINNDASAILVTKEHSADDTGEYINDLYLYEEGALNLIAENTEYPNGGHISDNGSILFFTGYDMDIKAGTLYIKREGEEPELIAEDAHISSEISEDGAMIVFVTNNGERQLHCLYNGRELELSEDIAEYHFSRSSNTLAYISSAGGRRQLYMVKEDGAPQRIADADAVEGISADGSCVIYIYNAEDETEGDLYAVWDGQQPVLVDTNVCRPYISEDVFRNYSFFEMNNDGSIIVYYKEHFADSPAADLYVKQQGEEPILVDTRVALGFKLF